MVCRGGVTVDSRVSVPVRVKPELLEDDTASNDSALRSCSVCCSHDCPAETRRQRTAGGREEADGSVPDRLLATPALGLYN